MGFNLKRSSTVAQQNSGDRIQETGVRMGSLEQKQMEAIASLYSES
jgi:hypothetical protein